MKEHRNSLNAVQALKTPLPLHELSLKFMKKASVQQLPTKRDFTQNSSKREDTI